MTDVRYTGQPQAAARDAALAHGRPLGVSEPVKTDGPDALTPRRGSIQSWLAETLAYEGDECRLWPFSVQSNGYGDFRQGGEHHLAHRWVCKEAHGEPPFPAADAAHDPDKCTSRLCCTKRHLRWATRRDNLADMRICGTMVLGEKKRNAKLRECDISIARDCALSQSAAAEILGVSASAIQAVRDGRTWKHVK